MGRSQLFQGMPGLQAVYVFTPWQSSRKSSFFRNMLAGGGVGGWVVFLGTRFLESQHSRTLHLETVLFSLPQWRLAESVCGQPGHMMDVSIVALHSFDPD